MEYFIHLGIMFAIYTILGMSLNLVVGYTGLLSVTHSAFYGIGAYVTGILLTQTGVGFFTSVVFGIIITMFFGLLIGVVLSRFKDDYYALASLGFGVIVFSIFLNWQSLTRGPLGISRISRPELKFMNYDLVSFDSNFLFLILAGIFAVVVYFVSKFITESSFGRVLKAIREDEKAIQVFGYNTHIYKLVIFVIGAGMASVAGSLFASYITFIHPSSFYLSESIFILTIIIIGGLANMRGVLLGALFLILLPEVLRFVGFPSDIAAQMRQVFYGLALIILMLYRPKGFLGEYEI